MTSPPPPQQQPQQPPAYGPPTPGQPAYGPPAYGPPGYAQPAGPPGHPPVQYAPPGYPPVGYRPLPPPALSPGGQRLAEFTDRLVAYIIDSAILAAVISVVVVPVNLVVLFRIMDDLPDQVTLDQQQVTPDPAVGEVFGALLPLLVVSALLIVFALAVYYVYEVEMMFRSGQTLGKRIMKIRVVPMDPSRTLTRGMAARRFLIQYGVGSLVPFFSYVDGFWQLWDKPYRQCLHDKWAATVVIKLNP